MEIWWDLNWINSGISAIHWIQWRITIIYSENWYDSYPNALSLVVPQPQSAVGPYHNPIDSSDPFLDHMFVGEIPMNQLQVRELGVASVVESLGGNWAKVSADEVGGLKKLQYLGFLALIR